MNLSMKLLFLRFAFSFFFWMIGELVRTSPVRLLVTLDGCEFGFLFLFLDDWRASENLSSETSRYL